MQYEPYNLLPIFDIHTQRASTQTSFLDKQEHIYVFSSTAKTEYQKNSLELQNMSVKRNTNVRHTAVLNNMIHYQYIPPLRIYVQSCIKPGIRYVGRTYATLWISFLGRKLCRINCADVLMLEICDKSNVISSRKLWYIIDDKKKTCVFVVILLFKMLSSIPLNICSHFTVQTFCTANQNSSCLFLLWESLWFFSAT